VGAIQTDNWEKDWIERVEQGVRWAKLNPAIGEQVPENLYQKARRLPGRSLLPNPLLRPPPTTVEILSVLGTSSASNATGGNATVMPGAAAKPPLILLPATTQTASAARTAAASSLLGQKQTSPSFL